MGLGLKIATFLGRSVRYGELIGKSKNNGIITFKKLGEDGREVLTSFKNGKIFKTVEKNKKYEINGKNLWRTIGNDKSTKVINHESGITTYIKKENVKTFDGKYIHENRFSKQSADNNGNGIGLSYFKTLRPDNPNYLRETKIRFEKGDKVYQRSITKHNSSDYDLFVGVNNYKMPNGQIVSGDHYFKYRYSSIDDKMVRYDGYRGWFNSFYLNNNGNMVVNKEPHNWFNCSINPRYCRERGGVQYL